MPVSLPSLSRRAALAASLGAGLGALLPPRAGFADANAPVTAPADAALRVALAGRQRMLAQQVVGRAALALSGADRPAHLAAMRAARAEYDASHRRLVEGDLAGPLGPETHAQALAARAAAEAPWRGVSVATGRAIEAGEMDAASLDAVEALSRSLAEALETAAAATVSAYAPDALPLPFAMTLAIADRQRALVAQAVKHAAFVGLGEEARREEAAAAAAMVSATQAALVEGMPMAGVIAPPSPGIRAALAEAGAAWEACRPALDALTAGGRADPETLDALAAGAEAPVARFGAAVSLYVELAARGV